MICTMVVLLFAQQLLPFVGRHTFPINILYVAYLFLLNFYFFCRGTVVARQKNKRGDSRVAAGVCTTKVTHYPLIYYICIPTLNMFLQ